MCAPVAVGATEKPWGISTMYAMRVPSSGSGNTPSSMASSISASVRCIAVFESTAPAGGSGEVTVTEPRQVGAPSM